MNILIDKLPQSIEFGGQTYGIKTDRRNWLALEVILTNPGVDKVQKLIHILSMLDDVPEVTEQNIDELVTSIMNFYTCNEITNSPNEKKQKVYSINKDHYRIYADFIQHYNIDLESIEYLHWWKYRQMFLELPKNSITKEVMTYRAITINSKMSKEQKSFYMKMKRLYSLSDEIPSDKKASNFAKVLANGMSKRVQ